MNNCVGSGALGERIFSHLHSDSAEAFLKSLHLRVLPPCLIFESFLFKMETLPTTFVNQMGRNSQKTERKGSATAEELEHW